MLRLKGLIISANTRYTLPQNIVTGRGFDIEDNLTIYHGKTLGAIDGTKYIDEKEIYLYYPNISRGVILYTNFVILGDNSFVNINHKNSI